MRLFKAALALSFAAFLTVPVMAHADTLKFDNLPGDTDTPLTTYDGFNFTNFYVIAGASIPGTGYQTGVVSPPNVLYNGFSNPASFSLASPGVFTINNFELTSAYQTNDVVTVFGYKDGVQLYTATYIVGTGGPTLENAHFVGIDTFYLTSTDQAVLDNITYTESGVTAVTPEPGTIGLVGTGLVSLLGVARRKFVA